MSFIQDDPLKKYSESLKARILVNQRVEKIVSTGAYCHLCGYYLYPLIIEKHHIAGRRYSDITIPVCPNCHRILSTKQRGWPKDLSNDDNLSEIRIALFLRGFDEMNRIKSEFFKQMIDRIRSGGR